MYALLICTSIAAQPAEIFCNEHSRVAGYKECQARGDYQVQDLQHKWEMQFATVAGKKLVFWCQLVGKKK